MARTQSIKARDGSPQPIKTVRRSTPQALSHRYRHRRLSLHPVSLMTVLCAGVFLVCATIGAFGDSYHVTATVPADPPSLPAIISAPADESHVVSQALTVTGSCPNNSYVTLTSNTAVAGTMWCSGGSFSVAMTLQPGANQLNAQDYNALDMPGPQSSLITVYYDQPVSAPPVTIVSPVILAVSQVDTTVSYVSQTVIQDVSNLPTFSGVAPPFSRVSLLLHSNPIWCNTIADAAGYWQCTLPTTLPAGLHTVDISAVTTSGQMLKLPQFKVHVGSQVAAPITATNTAPLAIVLPYHYQAYALGQQVVLRPLLQGGRAPYTISISWGDGTIQTVSSRTSDVTLQHRYQHTNSQLQGFTVKLEVTDATGHTSSLQLPALIRNSNYRATLPATTKPTGLRAVLTSVHDWLWLLWPAYLIVVLMLTSFWLGERKQYAADRLKSARTRAKAKSKPRRPRHA